ncbi:MAG: hypothetical protein ACOCWF_04690, partial [Halochromatium sp.]
MTRTLYRLFNGTVALFATAIVALAVLSIAARLLLPHADALREDLVARLGETLGAPVEVGATYMFSVWAKAIARNHRQAVIMQLRFLPGNELTSAYIEPEIGGDWRRFAVAMEAPEGATAARLYIFTMHYWTSETLIDDALASDDAERMRA